MTNAPRDPAPGVRARRQHLSTDQHRISRHSPRPRWRTRLTMQPVERRGPRGARRRSRGDPTHSDAGRRRVTPGMRSAAAHDESDPTVGLLTRRTQSVDAPAAPFPRRTVSDTLQRKDSAMDSPAHDRGHDRPATRARVAFYGRVARDEQPPLSLQRQSHAVRAALEPAIGVPSSLGDVPDAHTTHKRDVAAMGPGTGHRRVHTAAQHSTTNHSCQLSSSEDHRDNAAVKL